MGILGAPKNSKVATKKKRTTPINNNTNINGNGKGTRQITNANTNTVLESKQEETKVASLANGGITANAHNFDVALARAAGTHNTPMAYGTYHGPSLPSSSSSSTARVVPLSSTPTIPSTLPRLPDRSVPIGTARGDKKTKNICPTCICELCICGSHRCPPTPVRNRYGQLRSTYGGDFKGEFAPAARVAGPIHHVTSQPFDATSTNRDDYKWHGFPARDPAARSVFDGGNVDRNAPFDGHTTHRDDYQRWPTGEKPRGRSMVLPKPMADSRDFQSENRAAFNAKDGRPSTPYNPAVHSVKPQVFDARSTHVTDYPHWPYAPARSIHRGDDYWRSADSRDFETEHRGEYVAKRAEYCPAVAVHQPQTKVGSGHVLVEQDDRTGTWRRTAHHAIPFVPSTAINKSTSTATASMNDTNVNVAAVMPS